MRVYDVDSSIFYETSLVALEVFEGYHPLDQHARLFERYYPLEQRLDAQMIEHSHLIFQAPVFGRLGSSRPGTGGVAGILVPARGQGQ